MARPQAIQKRRMESDEFALYKDDIRHISGSGVPTDGVTGANKCGPDSFYFDKANAELYQNIGTKASPVWTLISNVGTTS